MVLWDGGETTRGLRRPVAVLARAYSAKMNHLWGMRQNRPLLCMSPGGGVLSCVVMLWYLQSFPCRIVTNLWRNCLTFYYRVNLCKHESLIEGAVDLSLNAGQSDPA